MNMVDSRCFYFSGILVFGRLVLVMIVWLFSNLKNVVLLGK